MNGRPPSQREVSQAARPDARDGSRCRSIRCRRAAATCCSGTLAATVAATPAPPQEITPRAVAGNRRRATASPIACRADLDPDPPTARAACSTERPPET